MKINEVLEPDTKKLVALTTFLIQRNRDRSASPDFNRQDFIDLAASMGINVDDDTLNDLIAKEPLSNLLEPIEPNSQTIRFKGNVKRDTDMSVDQAKDLVKKNAQQALKRREK